MASTKPTMLSKVNFSIARIPLITRHSSSTMPGNRGAGQWG